MSSTGAFEGSSAGSVVLFGVGAAEEDDEGDECDDGDVGNEGMASTWGEEEEEEDDGEAGAALAESIVTLF